MDMNIGQMLSIAGALVAAAVIALFLTPFVKSLAVKVGAVDVPMDDRRMHNTPIPRLGGLAIFAGFIIAVLIFGNLDNEFRGVFFGSVIIVLLGIADDIRPLTARFKLVIQTFAAAASVISGVRIENLPNINLFSGDSYTQLPDWLSVFITIIWIVGITNAVNFIDGLDGLAVGISGISCLSVLAISILVHEASIAVYAAALAGACLGFMPFNTNPAKIFMGDTGATFLGYIIAVLSVQGLFKVYTVVAFAVPFLVMGLPIFDVAYAAIRRISEGRSPMSSDKEHLHHKLVEVGFTQKQAVAIMYFVSALLALTAVILTGEGAIKAIIVILISIIICVVGVVLVFSTPSAAMHWTSSAMRRAKTGSSFLSHAKQQENSEKGEDELTDSSNNKKAGN